MARNWLSGYFWGSYHCAWMQLAFIFPRHQVEVSPDLTVLE